MDKVSFRAFVDELTKIAARIPMMHGTSSSWEKLVPAFGRTVSKGDPNPRGIYMAMKSRMKQPSIERFAQEAVKARGGTPTILHAKVDTKKGWRPASLTSWGRENIGSLEDAADMVKELDTAQGARRGEIWRALHRGTGRWANFEPDAVVRPKKYQVLK